MFVCDATKSMTDDLKQLRDGADKILDKFSGLKEHPIKNYVLSLFRDQGKELKVFLGPRTGAKFHRLERALEITNHRFFFADGLFLIIYFFHFDQFKHSCKKW